MCVWRCACCLDYPGLNHKLTTCRQHCSKLKVCVRVCLHVCACVWVRVCMVCEAGRTSVWTVVCVRVCLFV